MTALIAVLLTQHQVACEFRSAIPHAFLVCQVNCPLNAFDFAVFECDFAPEVVRVGVVIGKNPELCSLTPHASFSVLELLHCFRHAIHDNRVTADIAFTRQAAERFRGQIETQLAVSEASYADRRMNLIASCHNDLPTRIKLDSTLDV